MLSVVGIQEASSKPKPVAPRRSGRPTLTRRAFSVAIAAPKKTPRIPTYGLVATWNERIAGGAARLSPQRQSPEDLRHWPALLVRTVAITDRPGRNRVTIACPPSSTIFTGKRCTIFVKLPVALSGGNNANCEPLAGDT